MTLPEKSTIDLGTDEHGMRLTWTRTDPYVIALGTLEVDVWDADGEPCSVFLDSDGALTLAQWINERLDRD
jgi:hypothetical protein